MKRTTLSLPLLKRFALLLLFVSISFLFYAQTYICLGNTSQLTGPGTPAAVNPWVSSNPAIASVDANGLVTANAIGTCTVTYTDNLGNTTVFTVIVPTNNPTISLVSGGGQTLTYAGQWGGGALYSPMSPIVFSVPPGYTVNLIHSFINATTTFSNGQCTLTANPPVLPGGPVYGSNGTTVTAILVPLFSCGGGPGTGYGGGGSLASVTVNITLVACFIPPPSLNQTICVGSPINYSAGVPFTSITGLPPGVNATSIGFTGTPTQAGSYTVIFHLPSVCGNPPTTASGTITVTAPPSPPTISHTTPVTFCQGQSVVLSSSYPTGNTWSNGATTQSITVSSPGSYTVTKTQGGCSVTSAPKVVTVNPIPATPAITASGPTAFCQGQNVTLTSSASSGNNWTGGINTQSITVTNPGTYTLTTTANGCTSPATSLSVVVNPAPAVPTVIASGPLTFCEGNSVTLTSSAAAGNTWSDGQTTQSITVTDPGNYSVSVSQNGCASAATTSTVNVNPFPATPTIAASGPLTFCEGESVTLTSSSATGNTWSDGQTAQSIIVTDPGSYSVTVDENGCTAASTVTDVLVNTIPEPVVSASGPLTFCEGGSVTLSSSAANGNSWSSGDLTQDIVVTESGDYTLNVSENGCNAAPITTSVIVDPLPSVPTIAANGPLSFCEGGSVVLTSSAPSGNTWSNGQTTQSITVNNAGGYSVTVNENGCTAQSPLTVVTETPTPEAIIYVDDELTFCEGGSAVLHSSYATGNQWSTGETTQSITVTESGLYNLIVNQNGCSEQSADVTVVENPNPVVSLGSFSTVCNTDNTFALSGGLPAGGTYTVNGIPNDDFEPATAVTGSNAIAYLYEDANGCSGTASSTIDVNDCLGIGELTEDAITVFPNPASGSVTIARSSAEERLKLELYDTAGRRIAVSEMAATETTLDLSAYQSGMYTLVFCGISSGKMMRSELIVR